VPGCDFVVFSADPALRAGRWQVLPLDERFGDTARDALWPRILPHLVLPDCDWSLWIDPDLFVLHDPSALLAGLQAAGGSLGAFAQAPQIPGQSHLPARPVPLPDLRVLLRHHAAAPVMRAMRLWWDRIGPDPATDALRALGRAGADRACPASAGCQRHRQPCRRPDFLAGIAGPRAPQRLVLSEPFR
jgi:hypothetical protein